jgi:hypothetical protein
MCLHTVTPKHQLSSGGATDHAAPPELDSFFVFPFYKHSAPTGARLLQFLRAVRHHLDQSVDRVTGAHRWAGTVFPRCIDCNDVILRQHDRRWPPKPEPAQATISFSLPYG